ncbi:hypothetical protein [Isoptericola aurantiacus]|uniref:hypothetical protein n=1 Tax=Isoptericola aurantiacus TaxID=3377839 RepID=UPI00383AC28B
MDDVGRSTGQGEPGDGEAVPHGPTAAERHGLPSPEHDDHGRTPGESAASAEVDPRLAQFSGHVGEVRDPLTWGLDLEDEALTGCDDEADPTSDRFVRTYRTFAGEAFEVETLRRRVADDAVEDVVRAAASGALAAPLHADIAAPVEPDADSVPRLGNDFADDYADYRSAMRAIVAEVDAVPLEQAELAVDGDARVATRVRVREVTAVHVDTGGRGLVVTGPTDLVERVDVVTRPIRSLLHPPGRR